MEHDRHIRQRRTAFDAHQTPGAGSVAHGRTGAGSATGRDRAAALSSAQALQAAVSSSRVSDLHRRRDGCAAAGPGVRPALGHRNELSGRKDAVGGGTSAGAKRSLGRGRARTSGAFLRHASARQFAGRPRRRRSQSRLAPCPEMECPRRPVALLHRTRDPATARRALGLTNFSGFVAQPAPTTNPEKFLPHLPSAVLYAAN